jgi:nitrite reductase (NADH) small subunit
MNILQVIEVADKIRLAPVREWVSVCPVEAIVPSTGVAALVDGQQIAIFRVGDDQVYAISNFDPFSKAFVLSRGIVGDRKGELKVASPIYKQSFSLLSGQCLDDASVRLRTWPARVVHGIVQISFEKPLQS